MSPSSNTIALNVMTGSNKIGFVMFLWVCVLCVVFSIYLQYRCDLVTSLLSVMSL